MATTISKFNPDDIGNSQVYNLWIEDIGEYNIMCGRYLKAHMREMQALVQKDHIRDKRVRIA